MKATSLLVVCTLWLGGNLAQPDEPAPKISPRVRLVRQMFEKVPPLVLDLTEPIEILKGAAIEDGGTTFLEVKDARGRQMLFHLDRAFRSRTRNTLFIESEKDGRTAVVLRGAEEAALYGLLLRWNRPAQIDWLTGFGVEVMLGNLDDRFAAEPTTVPMK